MSRRPARLTLSSLDPRVVPAVLVTRPDLDGDGVADDVRIVGDARNTKVAIQDNGTDTLTVSIDGNGDGDFADPGDSAGTVYNFGVARSSST